MKHFKLMKGVLACLLSLALVVTCFTSVGAKAEETSGSGTATVTKPDPVTATFDWSTNTISAGSEAVVYVLKAKTGNAIKKGAKSASLSKVDKSNPVVYAATMADLGIKKAKKEVYLYVCSKEFEEAETNITANLVIKAPAAKKVTGTIDYTKADGTSATFNVISATAVDDKKAAIKDPEIWWSTEAEGTYYPVNSATTSTTRKYADGKTYAPEGFDGKTLNEMLAAGGGTIYIKMAGTSSKDGDPQFGSQAVKVKIAKQAKASKIKLDAKKDTLSLKNGFDFGYVTKDAKGEVTDIKWFTILPQLKTAAVKTAAASIVPTTAYTPLTKKDSNAGKEVTSESGDKSYSYTAYKFKALSIDTIIDTFTNNKKADGTDDSLGPVDGKYYIAVRKSATEKKPASAYDIIELAVQSDKPLVYTQDNVAGQYLVATSADFDKKGIIVGTIAPNPGLLSTSGAPAGSGEPATSGYDTSFELVTKAPAGQVIVGADTNGTSYEYAILAQKDLVATGEKAIDWSTIAWKKLDPAKTKITSKFKTKYSLIDGTKTTAQLTTESGKAESSGSGANIPADYSTVKNFLVIRRAGDSKSAVRASNCIYLYVAKEGKAYNLYSTVANGKEADKYIIKFVKYTQNDDGTYGWNLAEDVEDVKVWVAASDSKAVDLPKIDGADLFNATKSGSGYTLGNAVELSTDAKTKGKFIAANDGKTAVSGEIVTYMAVREYANIKVVGEASNSGEAVGTAKTLGTVKAGKVNADTTVTAYADGTAITISLSGDTTIKATGYVNETGKTIGVSAASGEGFSDFAYADGKVTVKVYKADEIEVKVVQPVVKVYTITYDLNKPADLTSSATAPTATTTDGAKKTELADVTGLVGTKAGENDTTVDWVVKGWATSKDATESNVTKDTTYSADTTLYAVWGAKS